MPDRALSRSLWAIWWNAILLLRPAFSRLRTFMWFVTAVAGLTVRLELLGVTSIVRALNLRPRLYTKLLAHFHSSGIKLDRLSALWAQAVLQLFPSPVRVNGRLVLVRDGIKAPKRGKKMPAVKLLHQQSESNTKPEYIMGSIGNRWPMSLGIVSRITSESPRRFASDLNRLERLERGDALLLPVSPCFSLFLPVSPCFSLFSPCYVLLEKALKSLIPLRDCSLTLNRFPVFLEKSQRWLQRRSAMPPTCSQPVWVKTRPFVSRSHGSFRQLRTCRNVDAGRHWAQAV